MQLKSIHHCSIVVADMERAVKFYREVMGLQEIGIPSTFPPAGLRVRWFQLGDQHIHLMPAKTPDSISPRHMALEVDSAQASREYFRAKGVGIEETTPIPGADRFMLSDPDGNRIEIIEWQDPYQIVPINDHPAHG
jgi:catechol 2,3-dioxygenase-like lactoylglutathione lyase family enzyme